MLKIDLSGHRALVCGASKGIGAATAKAFAESGARVTVAARSRPELEQLKDQLPGDGHQALELDLLQTDALASRVGSTGLADDPYTILVCNAGGPKAGPLQVAELETFQKGFQTHVLASQTLVQLLLPGMKQRNYGRVINVISTSVKVPIPNLGVSNTIRGAVASWSKSLANELGPMGITVNNVLPGFTETSRLQDLVGAAAGRLGKTESEVIAMWKNSVPARRFAKPEETAAAISFLASPLASYINGINLPVDGGRTGTL